MNNDAMWKALADPTRRMILDVLSNGSRSTGDLAAKFPELSRFAVMKHLGVLEKATLVTHTRKGKQRINHLNAVPLRLAYERWVSGLDDSWASALTSIGRIAEQEQKENSGMTQQVRSIEIHQEHRIAANPEVVWSILTTRVSDWWRVPYRMFREGSEVSIGLQPGGGLVEQKGDAFVYWALVTAVHPGKSIEFDGMNGPVQGRFTFSIAEDGDGCLVTIDHTTTEIDNGEPEGYSGGWTHLANGLKELAEEKIS